MQDILHDSIVSARMPHQRGAIMGRRASVWFREQDGFYYTTYCGEQKKLSQDKGEAERIFHELHAQQPAPENVHRYSIGKIADMFLDYSEKHHDPDTFKHYKSMLNRFCAHVGKGKKVADLRPYHVTSWCDAYRHWSESTRAAAIAVLLACLNWAVEEGHLQSHPLTRVKRGRYERRDRILAPQERDALFKEVKDPNFGYFLKFLEWTGCRPFSEAAQIEAENVDLNARIVTLRNHKNRKKNGKPRIIYLCPEAKEILAALMVLNPTGKLFRNSHTGLPWTKQTVQRRFYRICKRANLKGVSAYVLRHQYITQALEKGVSVEIVAELVGNSPATIHKHYCHVGKRTERLEAAARIAVI
jgi:site-specific recombinase XerD